MFRTRCAASLIGRVVLGACLAAVALSPAPVTAQDAPPNILFAIADDWGWPHASTYGDPWSDAELRPHRWRGRPGTPRLRLVALLYAVARGDPHRAVALAA